MADQTSNKGGILNVTRSEQYKTTEELFAHSHSDSSYYTLLVLSSLIITAGLLANNSAIVIGGMLVAPVLTPVLVIALGLAVGELPAIRNVAGLVLRSFLMIIMIGTILAILFGSSGNSYQLENTFRAALLYFVVAIGAGAAGAFAWARKEISEVLPGIAIAVSLVPPLSLIGISLSSFNIDLSRFYFIIFLFNFIGIVMGGLVVFSLLKFYKIENKVEKEARQTAAANETKNDVKAENSGKTGK